MKPSHAVFAALLIAVFIGPARAGQWPQFRGPTGQGVATAMGLPLEWGPSRNVAWKRPIPGEGWSSPVVRDGRVYLTAAVPTGAGADDLTLRAICLDAGTGRTLWDAEVFGQDASASPSIHDKNSHASPTPIVTDEALYVHFGHQGTARLDLDGRIVWRNRELRYAPVHGNGGSPILAGDKLIFNADGGSDPFIVALDRQTGDVIWRTPRRTGTRRPFSFSTPLLIEAGGRRQVVSPASGAVFAYDPDTGREIWRVRYEGGYSVVPRPVFAHGLLYIGTGFGHLELLAIRPDGSGDVTDTHIAWRQRRAVPHTPSVLVVGDELYMVSDGGVATCLDAHTGRVHWHHRLGGEFSASPVYADGRIGFQAEDGRAFVIAPSAERYRELARNDLAERTLASWAVAEGALFIRTARHLYRIENRD